MTNKILFSGEKVLACIDGSSVSEYVCDYAAWIALTVDRQLKLLHTIEQNHGAAVSDYSGAIGLGSRQELLNELTQAENNRARLLLKQGQIMLSAAKQRVKSFGVEKIESYQHRGSLAESLVELEQDIRFMVIGIRGNSHESQAQNQGLGHQLESVIRSMHKPILVVNKAFSEPQSAMLAYDGSDSCKKALAMIASSRLFKKLPCHIVHVGDHGEQLLSEAVSVLQEAGIDTKSAQLEGSVVDALVNYQKQNYIEITLMGAFSHNRFVIF
ncbi:MAG: universal stress protein [Enterobacterales bacterium]|nr:universal stress protein [Enterobacterales bacterium]